MPSVDLNARREAAAAEAEQRGVAVEVKIGDDVFVLPSELPIETIEKLARGDITSAVRVLFGDEQADAFLAYRPSVQDVSAIVEAYGDTLGEAQASGV